MKCPVDGCGFESDTERGVKIHCGESHYVEENPYRIECECNNCDNLFTVTEYEYDNGKGQYCSKECFSEYTSVKCKCNQCGDKFTVAKSKYEMGIGKYCSNECQSEHKTKKCKCSYCGDEFIVAKSKYNKFNNNYCSRRCQDLHKTEKGNIQHNCDYCGDEITVIKSNYEKFDNNYCSRKCHALDKRKSNPDIRDSTEYREFRETVLERDDYRCTECGNDTDLHVHHSVPIYEDESLATDPDNGVTLCVECHAKAHERLDDIHLAELIRSGGDDDQFNIDVAV